jgi:hypothetical protein
MGTPLRREPVAGSILMGEFISPMGLQIVQETVPLVPVCHAASPGGLLVRGKRWLE